MKFKYVIVMERALEVPIIFSVLTSHDEFVHKKPISAGFLEIVRNPNEEEYNDDGYLREFVFNCYGESRSLRLQSRKEDSELIQRWYEFRC